jgi:hypothetical protein
MNAFDWFVRKELIKKINLIYLVVETEEAEFEVFITELPKFEH